MRPSSTSSVGVTIASFLLLSIIGCARERPDPTATSAPLLVDVATEAGIDFVHDAVMHGDYLFPEINGAGCAFFDFDDDGFLDIYLVQSGRDLKNPAAPIARNRLYRNLGDGTFEDVSEGSGADDDGYGQGVAVGDFDADGRPDLFVANVGGPSVLLHNRGDGSFEDITAEAGIDGRGWVITPAFLDFDGDGDLDLFVTNYVVWSLELDIECRGTTGARDYCGPRNYRPGPSILYRNDGDGRFTDVSTSAGVRGAFGAGMGIMCADFNDDARVDIYVANDAYANQLWLNDGDGTFTDRAPRSGCAVNSSGVALSSMGTNAEDFDGDGDLDLFSTNYHAQGGILYLQEEAGFFTDVSSRTRLYSATTARTGFGACVFDLDNDGGLEIYLGNGAAALGGSVDADDQPYGQRDSVLRWSAEELLFTDISSDIGAAMDRVHVSRGVAVGDYDNDGAVDLLISNNNGPARLLHNRAGGAGHWLMVRCLGPGGMGDALGATVWVTAGGRTRRRDVVVNHSYGSASDPRVHFGLGLNAIAEEIRVRWPGGAEAVWQDVRADRVFVARHPDSQPPIKVP